MARQLNRPFAVFDIDGTVIRWQLYHAMNDVLARKGIVNTQAFEKVKEARMSWKKRSSDKSFHNYEQILFQYFEQELAGLSVRELNVAADEAFEEYKDQVYIYTRDLILSLKAKNYLLFAISGSPDFIIEKLVRYYGFDDFAASRYVSRNGRFTGTIQLSVGKKAELLKKLIDKHQASANGSIGIGDSEGDIDMLNLAEKPIAFNPSNQLFQHALKKHWSVVVERKNVIYSLNYLNGKYQLSV